MKATELIEKQHRLVEDLFERFEEAEGDEKAQVFEELAANLVAHDAIERELFYPACEEQLGEDEDVLGESLVEHGVVEFCLFRADKNRKGDEFDKYVTVLKEVVMHHVKEEEDELLPTVEKEFDEERLESLGSEMEEAFAEAMKADFRKPLKQNLEQVLMGRTKTQKRTPARKPSKAAGARQGRSGGRGSRGPARASRGSKTRGSKARGGRAATRKSR